MPGFAPEKRHRDISLRGRAKHLAGVSVHAAGHIDSKAGDLSLVDFIDHSSRRLINLPRKPGPEQGINHDLNTIEKIRREWVNITCPTPRIHLSVSTQRRSVTKQTKAHDTSAIGQRPCGDKTIATVVSRSAQDRHRPQAPAVLHRIRNRRTGPFHKFQTRETECRSP